VRVPDDNEGPADHQPSPGLPGGQPPQAPGSPAGHGPPGYPPPGYGQPGPPPPGYGQPGYPPPGYGQQQSYGRPGYAPPGYGQQPGAPAPGGIPLRPLNLGDIFNGAVTSARRNPAATFGLAAIVMTVYGVGTAAYDLALRRLPATSAQATFQNGTQTVHALATVFGAFVGLLGLSLLLTSALTGMLSSVVGRGVLGRKVSLREAWRSGRVPVVILTAVLLFLMGIALPAIVVLIVVVLAVAHLGPLAVLVGVVGGIASIVIDILLLIRLSVTLPALVLERISPWQAIRRSWELSYGSFWRLFGILLLTSIVIGIAAEVIAVPFAVVSAIVAGGGSEGIGMFSLGSHVTIASVIIGAIGSIVASTVARPISAAVSVLLYTDLRIRREGLDLTLRNAAANQSLTGEEFDAAWQPQAAGQPGRPAAW
jgi:hypothetical protein